MCLTVTLPIFVILQKQDLLEKFDGFFFNYLGNESGRKVASCVIVKGH